MHGFVWFKQAARYSCCLCEICGCVFDAMCMGSLIGFADRPVLVAICVGLFGFLVFLMVCALVSQTGNH